MLAKVRLRSEADGKGDADAFFLIHVENQAKRQPGFARRMFHYFARLEESYDLPIYPVALFSFPRPVKPEPDQFRIGFRTFTPLEFRFHAIQLNRLRWQDFKNKPNPIAAALMAKMHIAPGDRPRVKSECLRLLATLRLDPARMQLIAGFVDSYLKLNTQKMQVFQRELAALPQEDREATMPLTISWKEEGRVEGRLEGERRMLLRLGEGRFGKPSARITAAIEAVSSSEKLLEMGQSLFSVESWDGLLSETRQ